MNMLATAARRLAKHPLLILTALGLSGLMLACSGGGGGSSSSGEAASAPTPPANSVAAPPAAGASVAATLQVSDALASPPFNTPRSLQVPPGFAIRVWARVAGARFMALAPNGDVLVSVPSEGKIVLLRERTGDVPQMADFATGLHNPHDMVFHTIADQTYLYVAESNRVSRSVYRNGDMQRGNSEVVVDGLPDDSTPELRGRYGHQLKNIALGPDHKLYVSIASTCNACVEDTTSDPVRGAIYQYSADGKERRLFATGIRNAEGLDFIPGTNTLWMTVNGRDEIRVPQDVDVDGDGSSDLGKIIDRYVDEHPAEMLTAVRDGGKYGWPFCDQTLNASMSDLGAIADFEFNRDGASFNCADVTRASKGIRAHAAPLGFSFLQGSNVPASYRKGAAVALHGCWNCTSLRAGYKVVFFPFDDAGNAGAELDLVTGFVTDPDARALWGRPVDVIADTRGNLLISDDFAGAVYQLYPSP
ncbi:PQQ-dependent sugar dehydrogenase [Noviherbaspirillum autotrophicum]|nr:sugar dehydrogenase [Noviherbaspirillum autotrophicum]